jgi:hypothetical protein
MQERVVQVQGAMASVLGLVVVVHTEVWEAPATHRAEA